MAGRPLEPAKRSLGLLAGIGDTNKRTMSPDSSAVNSGPLLQEGAGMAKRARIRCINKTDRMNPHERIRHVGGQNNDGGRWKQTVDQTIREIESGEWEFFVSEAGRTVDVIVAKHNGHKYIKTTADGIQPDNLLSLPECP